MLLDVKTAVTYTRVSSKEQEDGFSLDAQRDLLDAYARRENIKIAARFAESETAKQSGKRPAFAQMLTYLATHQSCRVILVEKTDRLYRNLKDWIALDDQRVELHFVKEGTIINPESHSSQKFLHGIKVLMAKNYIDNLSEEIRKGQRTKAQGGAYPSAAPLGYRNTPDRTKGIEPDPETAPIIREFFERASTGQYSVQHLTRLARTLGLHTKKGHRLSKNTLCENVLRNPAYYGTFRWAGARYQGNYEPLITKTLFDAVQRFLDGRGQAKARKHTFTYTGLLRCGQCKGLLSGDRKKGRYVYYSCAGTKGCRRTYPERDFDEHTTTLLGYLHVPPAVATWMIEELSTTFDDTTRQHEQERSRLQKRLTELRHHQASAYEDKLRGTITTEFWQNRTTAWQVEIEDVTNALRASDENIPKEEFLDRARRPLELLQIARDEYVKRNPQDRRELLHAMVSNYTITEESLFVSWRSPFDILAAAGVSGNWWS